nr:unnamed protein product [Salmo salar]|eukprot:XP_014029922.1 PREDICTED: uncharacterized protein LOC106586792 isoform X1 [Salmo salar]
MMSSRSFCERQLPEAEVGLTLAVAQDHLRKKDFERFSDMTRSFTHKDQHRSRPIDRRDGEVQEEDQQKSLPPPQQYPGPRLGGSTDLHPSPPAAPWAKARRIHRPASLPPQQHPGPRLGGSTDQPPSSQQHPGPRLGAPHQHPL